MARAAASASNLFRALWWHLPSRNAMLGWSWVPGGRDCSWFLAWKSSESKSFIGFKNVCTPTRLTLLVVCRVYAGASKHVDSFCVLLSPNRKTNHWSLRSYLQEVKWDGSGVLSQFFRQLSRFHRVLFLKFRRPRSVCSTRVV